MFKIEGETFIVSDTHLGHANIIKYCNRPYKSVHHMDESITKNWNEIVPKSAYVIHLGDFSFNSERYINRLNGKIILVKGNHDHNRYDNLFEGVVSHLPVKIGEFSCYLTHIPIELDRKYKKDREPDFSVLDRYDFIICGHVHGEWKVKGKNVNVGIDVWDMKPIHMNELTRFLRSLSIK